MGDRSVAGNLTGIINQCRLRPNCKQSTTLTDKQKEHVAAANVPVPNEVFVPKGSDTSAKPVSKVESALSKCTNRRAFAVCGQVLSAKAAYQNPRAFFTSSKSRR